MMQVWRGAEAAEENGRGREKPLKHSSALPTKRTGQQCSLRSQSCGLSTVFEPHEPINQYKNIRDLPTCFVGASISVDYWQSSTQLILAVMIGDNDTLPIRLCFGTASERTLHPASQRKHQSDLPFLGRNRTSSNISHLLFVLKQQLCSEHLLIVQYHVRKLTIFISNR